jgi:hypothetical protein
MVLGVGGPLRWGWSSRLKTSSVWGIIGLPDDFNSFFP